MEMIELKVLKLFPDLFVEIYLFLNISESYENYLLKVDNFLIWDYFVLQLLSFLLELMAMLKEFGWLSLLFLLGLLFDDNLHLFLNVLWDELSLIVELSIWVEMVSM